MKNHENHDQHEGQQDRETSQHHGPYWKRAHHDWKFWIAIILMLVAIGTYVGTIDLSFGSRSSKQQPIVNPQ